VNRPVTFNDIPANRGWCKPENIVTGEPPLGAAG